MDRFFLYSRLCVCYPALSQYKSKITVKDDLLYIECDKNDIILRVLDAINKNEGLFLRDSLRKEVGVILNAFTENTELKDGCIVSDTNIFFKEDVE